MSHISLGKAPTIVLRKRIIWLSSIVLIVMLYLAITLNHQHSMESNPERRIKRKILNIINVVQSIEVQTGMGFEDTTCLKHSKYYPFTDINNEYLVTPDNIQIGIFSKFLSTIDSSIYYGYAVGKENNKFVDHSVAGIDILPGKRTGAG